jgi:acyl carrier protein
MTLYSEIQEKLMKYISTEILKQPDRRIDPDAPLLTGGIIDSFSLIDLALYVEDEFGVHIDDSELNSSTFDTINQLVKIIETRHE